MDWVTAMATESQAEEGFLEVCTKIQMPQVALQKAGSLGKGLKTVSVNTLHLIWRCTFAPIKMWKVLKSCREKPPKV